MGLYNVIGNVIGSTVGGVVLPTCVRDSAVSWHKNLNNYITGTNYDTIVAADFDGIDDYVGLSSIPDVTGDKVISFKTYKSELSTTDGYLYMQFKDNSSDYLYITLYFTTSDSCIFVLYTGDSTNPTGCTVSSYTYTQYLGEILNIEITKTTSLITKVTLNGNVLNLSNTDGIDNIDNGSYIGAVSLDSVFRYTNSSDAAYVWNININNEHAYVGEGVTTTDWEDTIGIIDGTLYGTPISANLVDIPYTTTVIKDAIGKNTRHVYYGQYLSSGTINFYRTEGTYDYVDPSTGNLVSGNVIPIDGLVTIPVNGICEITTDDGSYYPVCERAGTVIHDVNATSRHISVNSPVWDESLYGSDYLNQKGYVTKTDFTDLGENFETVVDGSIIVLDDDCLVPLVEWTYQLLYDLNGEQLFDVGGEPLYAKI